MKLKETRLSRYGYACLGLYETLYITDPSMSDRHTWFIDPNHPALNDFIKLSEFIKDY